MAATTTICDFGWQARDFRLPGTDGKIYSLADIRGEKGTLIMFICNHCPYVRAVIDRIVRDAVALEAFGVRSVAVSSNDAVTYPDDSFEKMKVFAAANRFPFPYLYDESQTVARAYGAVCTPDFFGFSAGLGLQYRGRLDESGRNPVAGARRELFEAMQRIAETGEGPREQTSSIGCSIKWKAA
ncbi:MAG: thioredoxin family protein [Rhodomicrobiaceae bacterium]